ncbi:heparan-alpha-glucosaminide N-acetyltransferase domain-containing protein [Geodermatophilus ruber]|uniref:heparan-alpha-glucosaminide N-acetyltransferase domain-containing protein n=1 Tax=Geodermatophilus ruber TaxID=504800 RepID=UPI001C42EE2F|nr:heparan-alpha-glucosaminide N-acetyltransferase domain-containing protein [Geodermatophilus ruber]
MAVRQERPDEAAGARPGAPAPRVGGIDLARGLAVLGMFGAHMGLADDLSWDPATWSEVVNGRSSILFAVLAGVSMALLSGRTRPPDGDQLVQARVRILVRAAWLFAIGGLLELLDTFVAVILPVYAVLFVLAVPFLRWSPPRLLTLAGALAVVAPPVDLLVGQLATEQGAADRPFTDLLFTGVYPAVLWWAFVLVGLAVGRLDLGAARVRAALVPGGATLAALGYAGGWLSTELLADGRPSTGVDVGFPQLGEWDAAWLSGAAAHGGTTFEVLGSTGVALAVIGLCLVLADRLPRLTYPLAAVGALALSVYSAHLVALWWLDPGFPAGAGLWLRFCTAALLVASLWRLLLGRGALERLLTWSSGRAAGTGPATARDAVGPPEAPERAP